MRLVWCVGVGVFTGRVTQVKIMVQFPFRHSSSWKMPRWTVSQPGHKLAYQKLLPYQITMKPREISGLRSSKMLRGLSWYLVTDISGHSVGTI